MEVLFLSDVPLNTTSSGAENVLHEQVAGLNSEGLKIYAITRKNDRSGNLENKDIDGVTDVCYFAARQRPLRFLFTLLKEPRKILKRFKSKVHFSVSISHQPFTFFPLLIIGSLRQIPNFYVFHSPNHEEYKISMGFRKKHKAYLQIQLRKVIERYCLEKSQKVIVLSDYMKQKVIKTHQIAAKKIVVNPGGVDIKRFKFQENRNHLKEELNFPDGKIHLLTVRNLESRMGIDNLLIALSKLKDKFTSFHLTIGGEGLERKNLEKMILTLGLRKEVTLRGFIPAEQLPKYFGAADFFVLPTKHLEGFGLVTVESLACGTPVLGTPVGGTKEILTGLSKELLFYDSTPEGMAEGIEKAIERVVLDQKKYNDLRKKCHDYAKTRYSWNRHVRQLKSIIIDDSAV